MKGLILSFCSKRLVAVLHLDCFHHTIDENYPYKLCLQNHDEALIKSKLQVQAHGVSFFFSTFIFIALPLPQYLRDIRKTTSKHSSKASFKLKYMGCHFFNLYFHFYSPALTPLSERYMQNHKQASFKRVSCFFAFAFLHFYSPAFTPLPEIHTYIRNDNSTAKRSIL